MDMKLLEKFNLPEEVIELLKKAPSVTIATKIEQLHDIACKDKDTTNFEVSYTLPNGETIVETDVVRVKNGVSANYREAYMRRRDPKCMVIADDQPSDKDKFDDRFGYKFDKLRNETFEWLATQNLAIFGYEMGQGGVGGDAFAVCPLNAGFFAFGLGLLQGVADVENLDREFKPISSIYVAPPFRHTHFDGKQVVVHNRVDLHEIWAYNLYPGPSAKKGVYGALINRGVSEEWVTAHCSAVQVITPYDNAVTFMHEGASGGGKSEMLQQPHRMSDGRMRIGKNIVTGEERFLEIQRTCDLHPVCDDMGLCHPDYQEKNGKLWLMDAEHSWFLRVDHITEYGTDHDLESVTVRSKEEAEPYLFLNIDAVEGGTALIWEHIEDEPGVACPNPRVVVPRDRIPGSISEKVAVDIRSFGVRTPPCTKENPTYGIMGIMHVLPPALAWLWRLVAPRGFANPSIVDNSNKMTSEGVGSYWPFATGRKVDQANLLLQQVLDSSRTHYILCPNQHIGAWKTGFMPQWLARDYLARRGHAQFQSDKLSESRCSLLGYSLQSMRIEGTNVPTRFLKVERQDEVGEEAYDAGAAILREFFHEQIKTFLHPELNELGRKIIETCLNDGTVEDYQELIKFDHVY